MIMWGCNNFFCNDKELYLRNCLFTGQLINHTTLVKLKEFCGEISFEKGIIDANTNKYKANFMTKPSHQTSPTHSLRESM